MLARCSAALATLALSVVAQTVRHVPGQHATIQAAIWAAQTSDTVLVAPGRYVELIDFLGKAITVKSSDGSAVTIIDGNQAGSVVTFKSGETRASVLEGFTITNGLSTTAGAGIYCSGASPTIRANDVHGNQPAASALGISGGGIFAGDGSGPRIVSNEIHHNSAGRFSMTGTGYPRGGGVFVSGRGVEIVGNRIYENDAWVPPKAGGEGGGIWAAGDGLRIEHNEIRTNATDFNGGGIAFMGGAGLVILGNVVEGNRIEGVGGGIYALAASALIAANRIVANRIGTERGGTGAGIAIAYGSPAIQVVGNEIERNRAGGPPSSRAGGAFGVAYWAQNRFVANFAYGSGGGLEGGGVLVRNLFSQNEASVAGGALFDGDVLGNVFTQNKAFRSGGLELTGSTRAVVHCTFHANVETDTGRWRAGGLFAPNGAQVRSCIFWANSSSDPGVAQIGGSPTVDHCDVEGGYPGTNNIAADPLFAAAAAADLHLLRPSPCVDAGNPLVDPRLTLDLEDDPRVALGGADMGADEFHRHLYWLDTASPGKSIRVRFLGEPNDTVAWILSPSSALRTPPLSFPTLVGELLLEDPLVVLAQSSIPATGLTSLSVAIPAGLPAPTTFGMQALVGQQFTNVSLLMIR